MTNASGPANLRALGESNRKSGARASKMEMGGSEGRPIAWE